MTAREAAAAELVVAGCGTVVPEADRACSSYWVSMARARVLFDCGPGAVQALARLGLPWGRITDLVLSHFHADHVGALPGLLFAFRHGLERARTRSLTVWGPAGTRGFMEKLARAYGDFVLDPGFPLRIEEVTLGRVRVLDGGPRLAAHKTPHTAESVAWRLDGADGSFGYSGDTGPSDELGPFMRDVAAFVCECSLDDPRASDNHLSPSRVASIASAARPRNLVLTHMYPDFRQSCDVRRLVAEAGYDGDIHLAREGLRVTLTNG